MFRITRRHSLATLTVLAGLFGAAAPAVAAPAPFLVDGPYSAKAPSGYSWGEHQIPPAVTAPSGSSFVVDGPYSAKAPSGYSWGENQIPPAVTAPSGSSFVVDGPLTVKRGTIAGDGIGA